MGHDNLTRSDLPVGAAMDIATVIVGLVSAAVASFTTVVAQAVIPKDLVDRWRKAPEARSRIVGEWDSWWGKTANRIRDNHEIILISEQRGERLFGTAKRDEEPGKIWELEGRFDGHHLQMIYFPSATSANTNFLDYGCYFFVRRGNGTMKGLSVGRGPNRDDVAGEDTTEPEFCYMEQRR
jgi:hypothetical protein